MTSPSSATCLCRASLLRPPALHHAVCVGATGGVAVHMLHVEMFSDVKDAQRAADSQTQNRNCPQGVS